MPYWGGSGQERNFDNFKESLIIPRINTFVKLQCNLTKVFGGDPPYLISPYWGDHAVRDISRILRRSSKFAELIHLLNYSVI